MHQQLTHRIAAATQVGAIEMADQFEDRLRKARSAPLTNAFQWVWVVLIGILVVAAAAGFVYCRSKGYDGFSGNVEAVRGPMGVQIGVKIGCY